MTVDHRSLFVGVQRRVLNHFTPTRSLGVPRIAINSARSYDTSSFPYPISSDAVTDELCCTTIKYKKPEYTASTDN